MVLNRTLRIHQPAIRRGNQQIRGTEGGSHGCSPDPIEVTPGGYAGEALRSRSSCWSAPLAATAQAAPPTTDAPTPAASAPEDTTAAAVTEPASRGLGAGSGGITSEPFGEVDGEAVELYTLTNANGMEVKIMTYGGIIQSVRVPDRDGNLANVTLNQSDLDGYVDGHPVLREHHRPLRQPHRPRHVHPRRGDVPPGPEQRREHPARRRVGFDKVSGRPPRRPATTASASCSAGPAPTAKRVIPAR